MTSVTAPIDDLGDWENLDVLAVVVDVEITEPLPAIEAFSKSGKRVRTAWLLARIATEPVGVAYLDVPDSGLSPEQVADGVMAHLGSPIRSRIPSVGDSLHTDGLALDPPSPYLARRREVLVNPPLITVVICTRERPELLVRCLESVLRQDYPEYRILIVDNAPTTDRTAAIARKYAEIGPVDYTVAPVAGLSHARNVAIANATGEVVASIDDDEIADRFWLAEIARAFADVPDADAVTGAIIPAELETQAQMWFEQYGGHSKGRGFKRAVFSPATRDTHHPLFPLPPFGAGGNMAIRASALRRLGGFDVALGAGTPAMGGEDTQFFTRLLLDKGVIVFQPSMLVRHRHRRDIDGLRTQFLGYGTGLTALYTSLLIKRPWLIFPLLGLTPRALREVFGSGGVRTATLREDFPRELLSVNKRGLRRGPWAYVRGRRLERKRRATQ